MQTESNGIHLKGLPSSLVNNLEFYTSSGQWSRVLESLSLLDNNPSEINHNNNKHTTIVPKDLMAKIHEMVILELAKSGDLALAYSSAKQC